MSTVLDYRGLRCPQPILKAALEVQRLGAGITVEIIADCPDFPDEVKAWCEKTNRTLINLVDKDGYHMATIQS